MSSRYNIIWSRPGSRGWCGEENISDHKAWIVQKGKFSFFFSSPLDESNNNKAENAEENCHYDPFGLLTPYIVRAKMLTREAWMEVLGWDEQLPTIWKRSGRNGLRSLEKLMQFVSPGPIYWYF